MTQLISTLVNSPVALAVGMSIIVDPITKRLEFNFMSAVTLLSLAQGNKMATILGLSQGSSIPVNNWLARNLPNLIGLENIYISCTELSGGDHMIDSVLGQLNIFTHVPVMVPFGTLQHYASPDQDLDMLLFPADRNLDNLTIKLYDDRGKILDLQGLDWQMILKVFYHTNSSN